MVAGAIGLSQIVVMLVVFFLLALGTGILYLVFSLARYWWRKGSNNS